MAKLRGAAFQLGGAQGQRPQIAAHLPRWRRSKENRVDGEVWTQLKIRAEFRDGEKPVWQAPVNHDEDGGSC